MDDENEENLKELFERFFDAEQAKKCIEDIEKGEQILRQYPAPEPGDMLVANIKAEIAMRLPARKATLHRRFLLETVAAAAAIILIAFVGLRFFETQVVEPGPKVDLIPASIWESK